MAQPRNESRFQAQPQRRRDGQAHAAADESNPIEELDVGGESQERDRDRVETARPEREPLSRIDGPSSRHAVRILAARDGMPARMVGQV